ncbi:MAG TPA: enoyl-CoA hydratase/isomerase family protein [Ilumatobacteraceae bacterium]|nr:enoyl-CoA hydratase/isomerase family protein [Ilumatobacteraceae bacterium]
MLREGVADVVAADQDEAELIRARVAMHPLASAAAALLLRDAEDRSVADGLLLESATYSTLQAGPEFAAWRARTPRKQRSEPNEAVQLDRHGDTLTITLNRPHVRNALNSAMRDHWLNALDIVDADPSLTEVQIRGVGQSFCAGGDLDEFGSFANPAEAHLVRLEASIGRRLSGLPQPERVSCYVHGHCAGSGIELPAFCAHVVAHPDATFALPELDLGLVPGAGGTVSLVRRIGRLRTAWLYFTGRRIDAPTALDWGLIDRIDESAFGAAFSPTQTSGPN